MTSDTNSPTVVARDLSEHEAMALVSYFRECGFAAHPSGINVAALYTPFRPGFAAQVVVRQSEAEIARKAVEEFRRQ